ncbi:hypothetical protein CMI49_01150 [Candidatus Pacearchaeota archaeon]|jgi:hypothetical protein|nr:hypothetical protein [Candidatus Pacearchaeota archaeon]|tara:strand:- start:1695 stop:2372 length:678 start_codon:yes stop_codon:yes gene_type:complete
MYSWIIENKELLKIFYGLIIALICFVIVLKTNKLFRLSLHKGIRYFRNAFFFYGIAFIIRYLFGAFFLDNPNYYFVINILFEYFLVMGGFFLLYSLLWKRFESSKTNYNSSLFNTKIFLFYFMSFIIVFLDYIWQTYYFMFSSQIIIFVLASVISYINYKKNGRQHKFLKLYFIAMILSLITWVLNFLVASFLDWNKGVLTNVYLINIVIFLLFLYGVIKVTGGK